MFWARHNNEFVAYAPRDAEDKLALVDLLTKNADHDVIMERLQHQKAISRVVFGRRKGRHYYPTAEHAAMSAINSLLREWLGDCRYYEWVTIKYEPINIRDIES